MHEHDSLLGSSPIRPDGEDKASGRLRFLDDLPDQGSWYGATVRSPHPRARIRSLGFDANAAPAGSVFVHAKDIPGINGLQILDDSWPILADDEVNHVGEAVALVAARSREDALRAARAVEVEYEPVGKPVHWVAKWLRPGNTAETAVLRNTQVYLDIHVPGMEAQ